MGEFLSKTVGNLRLHGYPDPPRGTGVTPPAFARNFASAPATQTTVASDPGSQIVWNSMDVGTAPSTDVPITPAVTGIIRVAAVICLKNNSGDPAVLSGVQVIVQVGNPPVDTLIPFLERASIDIGEAVVIPVLTETDPQPIGVPTSISILLIAGDANAIALVSQSSSIDIQEMSAATG
jgi:hypothetical protein